MRLAIGSIAFELVLSMHGGLPLEIDHEPTWEQYTRMGRGPWSYLGILI